MNKGLIIALAILGVLAVLIIYVVGAGITFNNTAIMMENGIKAQYEQNKNNSDNYFKKLKETVQVPSMNVEDLAKLYDTAMTGRYGKDGSKAIFNWIKEQNPTIDSSIYKKIQDIIEAGRNSFEADQKILIDKKREYDNYRQVFPNSVFAGILGFPKINLNDYGIVTSEETEKAFKEKKSDPLKLR